MVMADFIFGCVVGCLVTLGMIGWYRFCKSNGGE